MPNYWAAHKGLEYKKNLIKTPKFFLVYGLYKVGAHSKQSQLYNNGKWRSTVSNNYGQLRSLHWYSQLDSFSKLSSVDSKLQNQFKFIINEITHTPWNLNQNCLPMTETIKNQQNNDGTNTSHLQTEYCAIKGVIKWLNWMKQSNVYKNTLVVIVSDHGHKDSSQIFEMWDGKPQYTRMHSLLLVKPFNATGMLQLSNTPMMNYDVPTLIFCGIGEQIINPWNIQKRIRRSVIHKSPMRSKQAKNYLLAQKEIKIQGKMFTRENWHTERLKF